MDDVLDYVKSDKVNISSYLQECEECKKLGSIHKYIRRIVKNYKDNENHFNQEFGNDYCRYFTYWLYKEKNEYNTIRSLSLNIWNDCIPCVWRKLEKERKIYDKPCNFDDENISYGLVNIKKTLENMCIINQKMELMEDIMSDSKKCIYFNEKRNTDLRHMLMYISTISSDTILKRNYFEIDSNCSLKKVGSLFGKIDCPPDKSTECPEQKECDYPPQKIEKVCSPEVCKDLNTICKPYCAPPECKPKTIIQTACPEQPKDVPRASEEQPENPAKNPYLQLPVTVFSSVIGTILFFLFLYKFTPFRSWFLNRIGSTKTLKHKIKQDMEREFLGAPFQPPYRDDQNSRPRVGYSQN
ncbi:hypothetical protein PVX_106730 [Plasmodium vivax]|uniref:VIR protein n=1 Tax=Plasmodium vivax (strain Salvador I) TaxID=126793 RepID=A5KCW9_PLAVS|nr:hypothetical protein PVX_106730 [Plasmodium vivax]EDL42802.1 hypothetical protein PVX_106730 [Plasmodium vivax]|eukprot:XP_001612593.1 hypothetical protein [Plasmodium vivax Sal-1]